MTGTVCYKVLWEMIALLALAEFSSCEFPVKTGMWKSINREFVVSHVNTDLPRLHFYIMCWLQQRI